jgi:hypothetical protein
VRSTPPLRSHNQYSTLSVDTLDNTDAPDCDTDMQKPPTVPAMPRDPPLAPRTRWEKHLPSKYIVTSIPSTNSLEVEVQIQGTNIGTPVSLSALLDCGATGIFMDTEWVRKNKITTRPLSRPIPVYNVDGSPNTAGEIKDIAEVTLRYKDHTELAHFVIMQLSKQNMILGYSWLHQHNPEVDWVAKEVTMSRCPTTCKTCTVATRLKHQIRCTDARKSRKCQSGGFPVLVEDCNDEDHLFHKDVEDLEGGVEDSPQVSLPSISLHWMLDLIDIYDNKEIEEGDPSLLRPFIQKTQDTSFAQ